MSQIQSIFGLQARQIIEPQFLDVKLFHDQTVVWRTRARIILTDYRRVKRELAKARYLSERHYLNMELAGIQDNFRGIWEIYRTVSREAWRLDNLYRENLDKRLDRLKQKSAV